MLYLNNIIYCTDTEPLIDRVHYKSATKSIDAGARMNHMQNIMYKLYFNFVHKP